ncbi:MAG: hypothetical protein HY754_05830 [Nitrospirae bacterium]|nr:hypothetical protein [Nitrospirota bacterium]
MKAKLILSLCIVLIIFNGAVFAESTGTDSNIEMESDVYHFPEINPEYYGLAGYRFLSLTGSEKAAEYEYPRSSFSVGLGLTVFPFPHRLHLDADILNKDDFFGDVRYAYRDIVMFRGLTRKVFHNLDNITLVDSGTSDLYTVDQKDADEKYNIINTSGNLFLRFKTPDFPFHLYANGSFIDNHGSQQQRFLESYSSSKRASREREVDWESKDGTIGINSHIGPVEMDISHNRKKLNIIGEKVYENTYSGNTLLYGYRPEFEGSTTTLKLHTSYTGRIVSAATVTWMDRKNNDSKAEADYFIGSWNLTYIPYKDMTFYIKYKHKKTEMDNPDTIPANYLGYSVYTSSTDVKPSISSSIDTLSGTMRYRPINRLTLNAEYMYERTDRDNSDEWKLPKITARDVASLSANTRIMDKMNLRAKYTHQEVDAPAYNTQPDSSDEVNISLSWNPVTWANGLLSYNLISDERDKLDYVVDDVQVTAKNREGQRDRLLGSITFVILKNLSMTPNYAYIRNKITQDLLYENTDADPSFTEETGVKYKDTAHSYGININYVPEKNINLNAEVNQIKGKGNFDSSALSESISSFSELNVRETLYSIMGEYMFKGNWIVGLRYKYNSFRDIIDNPYDDTENGIVRIVMATVSKKW